MRKFKGTLFEMHTSMHKHVAGQTLDYYPSDTKDVVLSDESIQARTDNFSRFDSVKVLIPFFLDEYEPDDLRNVGPLGGKMTVTDPEGRERRVRGVYEVKGE